MLHGVDFSTPGRVCRACKRGWHHECWGCACPCTRDDDEPEGDEAA